MWDYRNCLSLLNGYEIKECFIALLKQFCMNWTYLILLWEFWNKLNLKYIKNNERNSANTELWRIGSGFWDLRNGKNIYKKYKYSCNADSISHKVTSIQFKS